MAIGELPQILFENGRPLAEEKDNPAVEDGRPLAEEKDNPAVEDGHPLAEEKDNPAVEDDVDDDEGDSLKGEEYGTATDEEYTTTDEEYTDVELSDFEDTEEEEAALEEAFSFAGVLFPVPKKLRNQGSEIDFVNVLLSSTFESIALCGCKLESPITPAMQELVDDYFAKVDGLTARIQGLNGVAMPVPYQIDDLRNPHLGNGMRIARRMLRRFWL